MLYYIKNKREPLWLTEEQKKIVKEAYEKKQEEHPDITLDKFNAEYRLDGRQIPRSTLHTIIKPQPPKNLKKLHRSRNNFERKTVVAAFEASEKKEQENGNRLTVPAFLKSIHADDPQNRVKVRRWLREARETPKPQNNGQESQLTSSLCIEGELTNIDFDPNTKFTDIKT